MRLRNPIVYQVLAMNSVAQQMPLEQFGERLLLDGSDKANRNISVRIKVLDNRDDWFYLWLQLYDAAGEEKIELAKASSELDANRNGGAVVFEDWVNRNGVPIAKTRKFVDGLLEQVRQTACTRQIQLTDVDSNWFTVTESQQQKTTESDQ